MHIQVHPAETMLRGDEGYCPRNIRVTSPQAGMELVSGVFRDDGKGSLRRPERPFRLLLPVGFQAWQHLNANIFSALRSGATEIVFSY